MVIRTLAKVFKTAAAGFVKDGAMRLSAAVAFYAVFSLAPLLIIAIAIAGFFWGEHAAKGEALTQLERFVGPGPARIIGQALGSVYKSGGGGKVVLIGLGTLILSASAVMVHIQDALNLIWREERKTGRIFRRFLRKRLLSFAMMLGAGALLLVSLLVSAFLSAAEEYLAQVIPGIEADFWQWVNQAASLLLVVAVFAAAYKYLPDATVPWRGVWPGALVGGALFTGGKWGIGWYLARGSIASVYGPPGALMALLLWIYYSSMIFFYGAELAHARAQAGKPPLQSDRSQG